MPTAEKFSAKEAAIQIGTDARTLRKFIRQGKDLPISPVGQGNRYEFTAKEIKALKKLFIAWGGGKTQEKPAKKKGKTIDEEILDLGGVENPEDGSDPQDEIDLTTEEVDLDDNGDPVIIDEDDDEGAFPTDDDIEEIDLEDEDLD